MKTCGICNAPLPKGGKKYCGNQAEKGSCSHIAAVARSAALVKKTFQESRAIPEAPAEVPIVITTPRLEQLELIQRLNKRPMQRIYLRRAS